MSTNRDEEGVRENAAEQLSNAESNSASTSGAGGETGGDESLDLEGLDLTVETVDERISPSETNVFDK